MGLPLVIIHFWMGFFLTETRKAHFQEPPKSPLFMTLFHGLAHRCPLNSHWLVDENWRGCNNPLIATGK